MPTYRLYFLNREGRIRRALELECDSDDEALRRMEDHDHPLGMELWQRTRLVKRRAPPPG